MNNLAETLEKLINKNDEDFYVTMLNQDLTARKFSYDKKKEIVANVLKVTEQFKQVLIKKFGERKPTDYSQLLGVPVKFIEEKDAFSYNFIGKYYEKDKQIVVNLYVVNQIADYIRAKQVDNLLDTEIISQVVVAHELFHYMQELYPDTFIEQKLYESKILGLFKIKTKLVVLEEIGAVSFSKTLSNLSYNPLIYNKMYAMAKNKR